VAKNIIYSYRFQVNIPICGIVNIKYNFYIPEMKGFSQISKYIIKQ